MKKHRPGSQLAVALPEHWPRWFHFMFTGFWTAVLLTPILWYLLDATDRTLGCFEPLMGILGVFGLVDLLRTAILWVFVGDTIVEISQEPVVIQQPLEYLILQDRIPSGVRSMECFVSLLRPTMRSTEFVLTVPLSPATVDADGRRRIQGTISLPEIPEQPFRRSRGLGGIIGVRITFKGGFTHEEDHPFAVERALANPPEGRGTLGG